MTNTDSSAYGDGLADLFDNWYGEKASTDCVQVLHRLAGAGSVLELGVGTGRVAVPLAEMGHSIVGVDSSSEMIEQLLSKKHTGVDVRQDDMVTASFERKFTMAYCVDNTLFLLPDQNSQVATFRNVARHLEPSGRFIIEVPARVPQLGPEDHGLLLDRLEEGRMSFWAVQHDRVHQTLEMQQVFLVGGDTRLQYVPIRYAWPSELDLMAQIAGLTLEQRLGDWDGAAFANHSTSNISIYRKEAS